MAAWALSSMPFSSRPVMTSLPLPATHAHFAVEDVAAVVGHAQPVGEADRVVFFLFAESDLGTPR